MNRNAVINYMFDELENSEAIKLKDKSDYLENLRTENQMSEKITKYLKTLSLSKKKRHKIMLLVDDYSNSCRDTTYTANKIYYYHGFIDGIVFSNK